MRIRLTFPGCLLLLALALCFMVAIRSKAAGQNYYAVNTYGDRDSSADTFPLPLKTVFINLDTKSIMNVITFGDEGQMLNKKPLPIEYDSDTLWVSAAIAGCYSENGSPGIPHLEVGIIDLNTRSLVTSYYDFNMKLGFLEKQPGNRVYLGGETEKEPKETINGDFTLDKDYHFVLRNQRPEEYSYGLYQAMGPFPYIQPLFPDINLYKSHFAEASYIIRTESDRTRIIDTLRLAYQNIVADSILQDSMSNKSDIIAIIDTLIFDFNLNYEYYGKFLRKPRDLGRIKSHVKFYSLNTFALLDSLPVADYPPDDYPNEAFDVADIIGPYIVYYFWGGESLTRRAPAMLFIFDTRTNEATWLRVGWR